MAGRTVQWLHADKGWTLVQAYHVCFGGYMMMGVVNVLLSFLLSKRCELKELEKGDAVEAEGLLDDAGTELSSQSAREPPRHGNRDTEKSKSKFSQISRETRSIMYALWFLLMVDSLADGSKFPLALSSTLFAPSILYTCSPPRLHLEQGNTTKPHPQWSPCPSPLLHRRKFPSLSKSRSATSSASPTSSAPSPPSSPVRSAAASASS
ncbi:hypothetical protein K438DRAFT_607390 [Mycena galopus ATCC 62051]|nr:hypothetical protein K438DRAFT_607390 [Mycena galopus ATCC 62051]